MKSFKQLSELIKAPHEHVGLYFQCEFLFFPHLSCGHLLPEGEAKEEVILIPSPSGRGVG